MYEAKRKNQGTHRFIVTQVLGSLIRLSYSIHTSESSTFTVLKRPAVISHTYQEYDDKLCLLYLLNILKLKILLVVFLIFFLPFLVLKINQTCSCLMDFYLLFSLPETFFSTSL